MLRILVATDFSTRSDRALRRAALIASRCDGALTLVHVIDDDQPAYLIDRQRAAASELLTDTARTFAQVDRIATDAMVTTGDAFAGLLRAAEEVEADLIVVGPHRRQLLDTFVGTTAERTIRRSRRPVLMANAVPSGPYERVLLAIAFDDASRAAAEAARRLGLLQAEVTALHLFDAPALGMMKRAMSEPDAVDHYVETEKQRVADEFLAFLSAADIRPSRRILRAEPGPPAPSILACAEDHGAELIVVGTNQRKGLEQMLLGSVAQKLLLDAKPDVLVVPAPREAEAESMVPGTT